MRECPNWSIMDVNQLTGLAVDRLAAAIISGDFSEKKTRTFDFLAILCRCTFSERVIPRVAVERSERPSLRQSTDYSDYERLPFIDMRYFLALKMCVE